MALAARHSATTTMASLTSFSIAARTLCRRSRPRLPFIISLLRPKFSSTTSSATTSAAPSPPSRLHTLPDRVSPSQPRTTSTPIHVHMGALPKLLHWPQPPRTVLIVTKPESERTRAAFRHVARWLHTHHPDMNIVVERSVAEEAAADKQTHTSTIPDLVIADWENGGEELRRTIDFVITLGGDGTILHTSSLFPRDVPPIISFSLGTLGFLLPFGIETFPSALSKVIQGPVPLLHRMRLACAIYKTDGSRITAPTGDLQAMNDIVLHRGRYPHLTITECSVDGEFLTGAVADGLIVATPTGSTAYSLSAGGPLVHPSVPALVLTPICPRSLSFRPALLPADATVRLRLSKRSRETADVSVDGREVFLLGQEEYVEVGMSEYHIPCISRTAGGKDWVEDINRTLKWNQGFVNTFKEGE